MLSLSEILIESAELECFDDLVDRRAVGELHFQIDIKPPFPDTPSNWEDQLESAFTSRMR
jgi:hypothetical protein